MIKEILIFGTAVLVGVPIGYSFGYWKDKTFGGKRMTLKNEVVDTGEKPKRSILRRFKQVETPPKPQYVEYPPEPQEEVEVPQPIEKPDTEALATIQNIISDLNRLSDHMKTMADALTYLQGYLKGKGAI